MRSLDPPRSSRRLPARLRLAHRILASHFVQPATALWRLFECEIVLARLKGQGRGLDLGCGDGTLSTILLPRSHDLVWTGLDIDPYDASAARSSGIYQQVHVASAGNIPEPDRAFDVVFSNSALEHMNDLDAVLSDVRRVLKIEGRFVFTVPTPTFHEHLLWPRILRALGMTRVADHYVRHLDSRIVHLNYLSKEEWSERLERHNLHIVDHTPYMSARVTRCWETLANLTGGLAHLATAGQASPRRIQQSIGLAGRTRPYLGSVVLVVLLPLLLLTALERYPTTFACLYVEARRHE